MHEIRSLTEAEMVDELTRIDTALDRGRDECLASALKNRVQVSPGAFGEILKFFPIDLLNDLSKSVILERERRGIE